MRARLFGTTHQTCAIGPKGFGLYCWGSSAYGELGVKSDRALTPRQIKDLPARDPVVDMVFMSKGACVLLQSGYVMCWGDNERGTVGNPQRVFFGQPVYVQGLEGAVRLNSFQHSDQVCALLQTGRVSCWGLSDITAHFKALSSGSVAFGVAVETRFDKEAIQRFKSDKGHNCFLTTQGKVKCTQGTVGYKRPDDQKMMLATIDLPSAATDIAVFNGMRPACAVLKNGELWCWKGCDSHDYCFGDPNRHSTFHPIKINGVPKISQLRSFAAMQRSLCVLSADHEVYCWGHCREFNACHLPKGYQPPKLTKFPGIDSYEDFLSCKRRCLGPERRGNETHCGLFCDLGLRYDLSYQESVKRGEPVTPSQQTELSRYQMIDLKDSGLGYCGISKDHHVYCWGQSIYAANKMNKKSGIGPLNIMKVSSGWWR